LQTIAIIPAYNESETVGTVVTETQKSVDRVVVVNDGSTDETAEIARKRGATVITHAINIGIGGALRTGYRYAIRNGYDVVVQIDADGQHDPKYIPKLLAELETADVVIGSRYLNESYEEYSLVRQIGIKFFTFLVNLFGNIDITDVTTGFRAYRAEKLAEIIHTSDRHWAVEQTLEAVKTGHQITEVSIRMPTRQHGNSQFTPETFALYPVRMADVLLRIFIFR